MRKAIVALVGLLTLTLPMLASADEDRSSAQAERVEVAPQGVFALPGPIYDESGRLIAAPPPPKVRSVHDLWRRLQALPQAGAEPGRTSPRKRGEP